MPRNETSKRLGSRLVKLLEPSRRMNVLLTSEMPDMFPPKREAL